MTATPMPPRPTPHPERPAGDVVVHVFGRTDVGRTREHNEDAFVVADLTTSNATLQPEVRTHHSGTRGTLFMVADGMGGAAAGEIASAMAVDVVLRELTERWVRAESADGETFARALTKATAAANAQINAFAAQHPEYRGMGTTATIAGLLADTLYLAQVGDSRAYLVRDGLAIQITKDQSLLQKLIEAGEITEEEAAQSERRNIILQALGPESAIRVDLTHQRVRRGDTLVLCSDGLSGQVRADEIARVVHGQRDLVAACKALIELANERGGPDNITVIVARFEGNGLSNAHESDEVGYRAFPLAETTSTPAAPFESLGPLAAEMARVALRPSHPSPGARPLPDGNGIARRAADSPRSTVEQPTPARRGRGMAIAIALLVALLAAGSWYVYQTARRVLPAVPAAESSGARAR